MRSETELTRIDYTWRLIAKEVKRIVAFDNIYGGDRMRRKVDPEEKITCCGSEKVPSDLVDRVIQQMPNEVLLEELSDFFKVFGDPTRTKILWALDESELCVCDLGSVLGMTKSAVSHQLSTLRKANLVKFRRVGKNVFYSLKDDHVKTILEIGMEHIQE